MARRTTGRRGAIDRSAERQAAEAAAAKLAAEQALARTNDSLSANMAANTQRSPDAITDRVVEIARAQSTQLNNQPDALFASGPTPARQISEVAGVKSINTTPGMIAQPKTQNKFLLFMAMAVGALILMKSFK